MRPRAGLLPTLPNAGRAHGHLNSSTLSVRSAPSSSQEEDTKKSTRGWDIAYHRGRRTRLDRRIPGDYDTKKESDYAASVVAATVSEVKSLMAAGARSEDREIKIEDKEGAAKRKAAVNGKLPPAPAKSDGEDATFSE